MTRNNFQIDSAAISDRGLSKKRPQNEDSFLESAERGLFAVADGVGGGQAGEVASQTAVEILSEAFAGLAPNGDAEELMRRAIERANESVYQTAHDSPQLATMATTIVALHVSGNIATIGHVGDSRLYRLDPQGNLHRETGDHSVVEEEMRAGRLTPEQAANHPNRNIISRAVGADSTVEVDLKTIMFEPRTAFLLCSDGITRHIEDPEIQALLTSGDDLANIAQKMKDICYERGAEDNLTAVIVRTGDAAAGLAAPGKVIFAAEFEEPTVATPRLAASTVEKSAIEAAPLQEIPTGDLTPPPTVDPSSRREVVIPTILTASPSASISKSVPVVKIEKAETAPVTAEETIVNVPSRTVEESGGFSGKILSAVMWLILGGIAGAGLYYLFLQNNKTPAAPVSAETQPAVTGTQSAPSEKIAFETKRRLVDENPRRFIEEFTNVDLVVPDAPLNAEAPYLLGRAYLLDGQFQKAEQMFLRAREHSAELEESNRKVTANDIEIGLAVVGVAASREKFMRSRNSKDAGAVQTNTSANANLNSSANADANR